MCVHIYIYIYITCDLTVQYILDVLSILCQNYTSFILVNTGTPTPAC